MNSHFLAKALCSLAKLSCDWNKKPTRKERFWGNLAFYICLTGRLVPIFQIKRGPKKIPNSLIKHEVKTVVLVILKESKWRGLGEMCQHINSSHTWRGGTDNRSFTYRFIVSELQTCFVLHCSFAEVNSWKRQRERLVIKREQNLSFALTALSGSAFMHLILSTAHLNWPANRKGHLAVHAASMSVPASACVCIPDFLISSCAIIVPSSLC